MNHGQGPVRAGPTNVTSTMAADWPSEKETGTVPGAFGVALLLTRRIEPTAPTPLVLGPTFGCTRVESPELAKYLPSPRPPEIVTFATLLHSLSVTATGATTNAGGLTVIPATELLTVTFVVAPMASTTEIVAPAVQTLVALTVNRSPLRNTVDGLTLNWLGCEMA